MIYKVYLYINPFSKYHTIIATLALFIQFNTFIFLLWLSNSFSISSRIFNSPSWFGNFIATSFLLRWRLNISKFLLFNYIIINSIAKWKTSICITTQTMIQYHKVLPFNKLWLFNIFLNITFSYFLLLHLFRSLWMKFLLVWFTNFITLLKYYFWFQNSSI